jgi:hypothetical protein
MQVFFLVLVAAVACALLVLHAHSSGTRQEPSAPALPPEVKRLEAWIGTWDAEFEMMGTTSSGSEICRLDCAGFWLVTEHTGSFMGQPFHGRGLTGFDPTRQAYVGVWVDSTGGPMSVFTDGEFSADGKTFRAQVDGVGMDGKPARLEYRSTFPDARSRTFEVFQLDGAERELQMRIRYSRKG